MRQEKNEVRIYPHAFGDDPTGSLPLANNLVHEVEQPGFAPPPAGATVWRTCCTNRTTRVSCRTTEWKHPRNLRAEPADLLSAPYGPACRTGGPACGAGGPTVSIRWTYCRSSAHLQVIDWKPLRC